jgi:hypothetical protein
MAVVQGHAVRRRAGIAPNTLVMAQEGNVGGEKPPKTCPVRGCHAMWPQDQYAASDEALIHLAAKHPRHPLGREAAKQI